MELTQDTLLAILAAVLVADVLVVFIALIWTQIQRRRQHGSPPLVAPPPVAPPPVAPSQVAAPPPVAPSQVAAPPPAPMSTSAPTSTSASALRPVMASAALPPLMPAASELRGPWPADDPPARGTEDVSARGVPDVTARTAGPPTRAADPSADGLTGLLIPSAWLRTVADEEARIRRYHRSATVAMIEVDGLDRLVARLGSDAVERIVPAVADTLRRNAREADHVARLGTARFGILMPETDEILAINYIERVRRACDLWLESGAVALRLAIGWASSTGDGSLVDAESLATDRMYVELRRSARANPPAGPAGGAGGARGASGVAAANGGLDGEPAFGN